MARPRLLFLLLLTAVTAAVAADPPEVIHYQGVLRDALEHPIDGTVAMVFRLYDAQTGGNEILVDTHPGVQVLGGMFDAPVGSGSIADGSGPGIFGSLGEVFRQHEVVWVAVEVNGQGLSPRVQVASAAYALNARTVRGRELTTGGLLDLYVNAATGDDALDGLSPTRPVRTIQAALDRIPAVIHDDVTVHVAPGTYAESLRLIGRVAPGGAVITLTGSPADPTEIVVSASNTQLHALDISEIGDVVVEGFEFRDATSSSVSIVTAGSVTLRDVIVRDNFVGVLAIRTSLEIQDVAIESQTTTGLFCTSASRCRMANLTSIGNGYGIYASRGAEVSFTGPAALHGNTHGAEASDGASIDLGLRSDITVTMNTTPLTAELHGRVLNYTNIVSDAPVPCWADASTYGVCH